LLTGSRSSAADLFRTKFLPLPVSKVETLCLRRRDGRRVARVSGSFAARDLFETLLHVCNALLELVDLVTRGKIQAAHQRLETALRLLLERADDLLSALLDVFHRALGPPLNVGTELLCLGEKVAYRFFAIFSEELSGILAKPPDEALTLLLRALNRALHLLQARAEAIGFRIGHVDSPLSAVRVSII